LTLFIAAGTSTTSTLTVTTTTLRTATVGAGYNFALDARRDSPLHLEPCFRSSAAGIAA
jgi:hypothetical protein